jgi:nicotinamide-nucleotide amidase
MQALVDAARKAQVLIATAESCTGGMVSAAITDTAGSSAVFERGFVTYSNAAKVNMLGVRPRTLNAFGAVSEQVAKEMSKGAIANSYATLSVAITGIAGPGGSDQKPEGRVCFAVTGAHGTTAQTVEFGAIGRGKVREAATKHALAMLMEALAASPPKK